MIVTPIDYSIAYSSAWNDNNAEKVEYTISIFSLYTGKVEEISLPLKPGISEKELYRNAAKKMRLRGIVRINGKILWI